MVGAGETRSRQRVLAPIVCDSIKLRASVSCESARHGRTHTGRTTTGAPLRMRLHTIRIYFKQLILVMMCSTPAHRAHRCVRCFLEDWCSGGGDGGGGGNGNAMSLLKIHSVCVCVRAPTLAF